MAELFLRPADIEALLQSKQGPVARELAYRAQRVTNEAKRRANVDTGRMRADIHWELGEDRKGLFARIGTNVFYAVFVHEGTNRYRGNPFLRDALEAEGRR